MVYRVPLWFELENLEDFSEKNWRAIADSLRKALWMRLKPWNSNSTLSKMRPSTFKRRRSMSQTKHFAPLPRLWPCWRSAVCAKQSTSNTGLGRVLVFDVENVPETMLPRTTLSQSPGWNALSVQRKILLIDAPHRQMASKKALKTAQKSYKEVLFSPARKRTHKMRRPEQLERLLLTPIPRSP
jgi:hypothetical protein